MHESAFANPPAFFFFSMMGQGEHKESNVADGMWQKWVKIDEYSVLFGAKEEENMAGVWFLFAIYHLL